MSDYLRNRVLKMFREGQSAFFLRIMLEFLKRDENSKVYVINFSTELRIHRSAFKALGLIKPNIKPRSLSDYLSVMNQVTES